MKTLHIILTLLLLLSLSVLTAQETDLTVGTPVLPDSLMQLVENRIKEEFGISDNSSLTETAKVMELDLNQLKNQLGLDEDNSKLDKMRLRQLGINVYQVLLAQETLKYGFNETSTLLQISSKFHVPVKKLKSILKLDPNNSALNHRTLQSLNLDLEDILAAVKEFDDTLDKTGYNIILVGMLVVFVALFVTSIVIMQLRHLNILTQDKQPVQKVKINQSGKLLSVHPTITNNDIVAAITALQIYRRQIEERRRLALTFHREKANYWRAAGLYSMPNREFGKKL